MQNMTFSQLSGFIVQLVEHCIVIADVMYSNPVEASRIFHVSVRDNNYCLNCPDKCQDDFSLPVVHRGSPWTGSTVVVHVLYTSEFLFYQFPLQPTKRKTVTFKLILACKYSYHILRYGCFEQ